MTRTIHDWFHIVQAEYLEMPGLNLTKPQAQRLWSLDAATCDAVFDALEEASFLKRTAHDGYVLAAHEPIAAMCAQ
jgi:hypothetical protein